MTKEPRSKRLQRRLVCPKCQGTLYRESIIKGDDLVTVSYCTVCDTANRDAIVDRRQHRRRPVSMAARVIGGGCEIQGQAHNISLGGIALRLPATDLPVAAAVTVYLEFGARTLRLSGRIAWTRRMPDPGESPDESPTEIGVSLDWRSLDYSTYQVLTSALDD